MNKKNVVGMPRPEPGPGDGGTVNRALRILGLFAEKDHWGLNELARALHLPRASAHRLLQLCRPLDFVTQDAEGLYRPGLALYRLAGKLSAEMPLHRVAGPILGALRDRTGETALLTLLDRAELKMFFSQSASPSHPMRYTVELHRLQPLGWGAAGRVLLAYLSADEVETVVDRAEPSPLDGRALKPAELRRSLKQIRHDGHAVTRSQRTPDAVGLAVPFFDREGEVCGNLTLTVPEHRFDPARQGEWLAALSDGADTLMHQLGWGDRRSHLGII